MPRRLRRVSAVATAALAMAIGTLVINPATASADPIPGTPCSDTGYHWFVQTADVTPVVTHYLSYYVASGTSGSRTDTLSIANTVTTTINNTTEISQNLGEALAKVTLKVGFSVQTQTSTTRTESTSMQWSFSQPGYYGLYKGTRRVDGITHRYMCDYLLRKWRGPHVTTYTTYSHMEEGTVTCSDVLPPNTVRGVARQQLDC